MIKTICDRCGKVIDTNVDGYDMIVSNNIYNKPYASYTSYRDYKSQKKECYDLCDECYKKLKIFLGDLKD